MHSTITLVGAFVAILAVVTPATAKFKLKDPINLDTQIEVSWCRQYRQNETCHTRKFNHAQCYDFNIMDDFLNDNLETISVVNGSCVIWEKDGCHGDHTGMLTGMELFADNFCPNYNWKGKASSVKCCGGDPSALWCGDPGPNPKCTD